MKLFSSDIGHLTYHSKRLAYLLRHSKLPNHKGWIKVDVVQNELGVLLLDIQKIVYEDTKGRFEFSEDKSSVRALYGHSIDVNLGLEPTTPPPVLYHGTAEKYIDSIMKEGLRPRKRNFVHLSETMDMAKQVGTRYGSPVVLSTLLQLEGLTVSRNRLISSSSAVSRKLLPPRCSITTST